MPGSVGDLGAEFGYQEQGFDAATNQMAQIAAGRGLQALQALNQMQPGIPLSAGPMPMQPPGPPMAGGPGMGPPPPQAPPQPQGSPPMGGPQPGMMPPAQGAVPPGTFAARFPQAPPQAMPAIQGQAQAPPQAAPQPPPQQPLQPPQQQMPPMPQGGGIGMPGAYSLQQIVQAVQRANPGAPPNVLFKAVAGLVPLMRPADQEYWKMIAAQQAGQRLDQGAARLGQNQERINLQQAETGQTPLGVQPQGAEQPQADQGPTPTTAAEKIAKDIHDDKQAPVFGGWGGVGVPTKEAPAVRNAYARMYPNDNLAQKALKWQQEVKMVQTMNGPQQVRFRQLANSVKPFLSDIEDLSKQMNQSGMNAWNAIQLKRKSELEGNTEQGQLATRYLTALAGIRGELAQLENGGYAPHDASWQTAYQQINQDRGVQAQLAAIGEIKKIITYRIQGMDSVSGGFAPGQDNPYGGGAGTQPPAQNNVIRYDAQGNRIGQ